MRKITPFLWFHDQAEEAMNFYTSVFKNVRPGPEGLVMSVTFELEGQEFMALNGGPQFSFTPAISLFVNCESQAEVDELWGKLTEGGEEEMCGWLRGKFGLSWQIIPSGLIEMLYSEDAERASRAMNALLQMKKIDIDEIRRAYEGG